MRLWCRHTENENKTLQANLLASSWRLVGVTNLCCLEHLLSKSSICDWLIEALLTGSYARRLRGNHSIWIRRYKVWYGIARGARRSRYNNSMGPSRIVA